MFDTCLYFLCVYAESKGFSARKKSTFAQIIKNMLMFYSIHGHVFVGLCSCFLSFIRYCGRLYHFGEWGTLLDKGN